MRANIDSKSMNGSRQKITLAAVRLLRQSGLSGAGVNQVIAESRTPKGSFYHHFPKGKNELVKTALDAFGISVREAFASAMNQRSPTHKTLRTLFENSAKRLNANNFSEGCAVAAVVLDLDEETASFANTCSRILENWQMTIADGLRDVPGSERKDFAQFVLAALEGALILSRASQSTLPLVNVGKLLAQFVKLKNRGRVRNGRALGSKRNRSSRTRGGRND